MAKSNYPIKTFNAKILSFLLAKPSVRNVCKKKHSKKNTSQIYMKPKMNSYFHGFSYDKGDDNNEICIKIPLRI